MKQMRVASHGVRPWGGRWLPAFLGQGETVKERETSSAKIAPLRPIIAFHGC